MLLSKMADYGVTLMVALAEERLVETLVTTQALARRTALPLPTVSKLLKLLVQAGLVESIRGSQGGYRLRLAPNRISIAALLAAIDGGFALTQCTKVGQSHDQCDRTSFCTTRPQWHRLNEKLLASLERVTLEELMPPPAMRELAAFMAPAVSDQMSADKPAVTLITQ